MHVHTVEPSIINTHYFNLRCTIPKMGEEGGEEEEGGRGGGEEGGGGGRRGN